MKNIISFITKLLSSDVEKITNQIKKNFLENNKFYSSLPEEISQKLKNKLIDDLEDSRHDNVSNRCMNIQEQFIAKWLYDNDYFRHLLLKQSQLVFKDSYGDYCYDDWNKELNNFTSKRIYQIQSYLNNVVSSDFKVIAKRNNSINFLTADTDHISSIKDVIDDISNTIDILLIYFSDLFDSPELDLDNCDPYEYERIISDYLSGLGWESVATSGSGDQGADVIAEKGGVKLVVQCKLYNSPVGNKAVQEIAAAKQYYSSDIAMVVTNSSFTKPAQQLADSADVYLLHHSQLDDFDQILFEA